jgi:hypothetical protein
MPEQPKSEKGKIEGHSIVLYDQLSTFHLSTINVLHITLNQFASSSIFSEEVVVFFQMLSDI